MKTLAALCLACLLLMPTRPAGAGPPPRYRLTMLPLDTNQRDEFDNIEYGGCIRDTQIVGLRTVHLGRLSDQRAALWRQGRPLMVLDKTPIIDDSHSNSYALTFPTDVNRRGDVVGADFYRFTGAWSGRSCTAVLWQNGKRHDIPGFPAASDSIALGINDRGVIVGNYAYNNHSPSSPLDEADQPPGVGGNHAFLIRNGRVKNLWPGVALGVNNRGWIVGLEDIETEDPYTVGVLWRNGHRTLFKMKPVAINERGEVVGNLPITEDGDQERACVWQQGRVTFLSKGTSYAYALNDGGAVVGEEEHPASPHGGGATLWRDGRTYDLNKCARLPPGWVLLSATGINDRGWIIGNGGVYKTPKDRQPVKYFSFLLTPR